MAWVLEYWWVIALLLVLALPFLFDKAVRARRASKAFEKNKLGKALDRILRRVR